MKMDKYQMYQWLSGEVLWNRMMPKYVGTILVCAILWAGYLILPDLAKNIFVYQPHLALSWFLFTPVLIILIFDLRKGPLVPLVSSKEIKDLASKKIAELNMRKEEIEEKLLCLKRVIDE